MEAVAARERTALGAAGEALFILRPSAIPDAGVGCFALSEVSAGAVLSPGYVENFRFLQQDAIADDYLKYCVLLASGIYLSPQNFLRMGVFWYVNHAKDANLVFDDCRLYAKREIAAGAELTLYYSDLLTHPKNRLWVRPEHV